MAEYRTIGRADPNVAAQLAAQDQARKAAWHQALLGMLGQTVTGVAQTLQRRDEFQQQVKQQDRYYDLQRQQWEQSSQARDFAASQRLAQLAQEAPELAETLSQTAMGRRLLAQGGWDSAPQAPAFRGADGQVRYDNVPAPEGAVPPELPSADLRARRPRAQATGGLVAGSPDFMMRDIPPSQAQPWPGREQPAPAPGMRGYQTGPAPSAPMTDVGVQQSAPSQWDSLLALGRAKQAAAPLGALAGAGRQLASERRLAGTPATVANLDNLEEQLLAAYPGQEEAIREAAQRLRDALPQSESDQLRIALARFGIQADRKENKDILAAIKARMAAEAAMASQGRSMSQTAAQSGRADLRDAYLGSASSHQRKYRQLSELLVQVQERLGLDPGAFLAETPDPAAPLSNEGAPTAPTSPAVPAPAPATGKGRGKAKAAPRAPKEPDLSPPAYGVTEGQLSERQRLIRRITTPADKDGITPGSPEWDDAAARLWAEPKDAASVEQYRRVGRELNAAIKALAADPQNQAKRVKVRETQAGLEPLGITIPSGQLSALLIKEAPKESDLAQAAREVALLQRSEGKRDEDAERVLRRIANRSESLTALGRTERYSRQVTPSAADVRRLLEAGIIAAPGASGGEMTYDRLPASIRLQLAQARLRGLVGGF